MLVKLFCRVPPALKTRLKHAAVEHGLTQEQLVTHCIEHGLGELEGVEAEAPRAQVLRLQQTVRQIHQLTAEAP